MTMLKTVKPALRQRVNIASLFINTFECTITPHSFAQQSQAAAWLLTLAQCSRMLSPEQPLPATLAEAMVIAGDEAAARFPSLQRAFDAFSKKVTASSLLNFWQHLRVMDQRNELDSSNLLADVYLDLKKKIELQQVSNEVSLSKVRGPEYLRRTQFFSEPYMSRFLTSVSLKASQHAEPASRLAIIDPACGAGSMLVSAFEEMRDRHRNQASPALSDDDIFSSLAGYDLDPVVAAIGAAGLTIAFVRGCGRFPLQHAGIISHDEKAQGNGFFEESVVAQLKTRLGTDYPILITNPPYLGRRLMSEQLRNHIATHYPSAQGDLCTAFMLKCAEFIGTRGILAVVHQSTFWHLSSLSKAREAMSRHATLKISVALGAGAFRHLSGEKASVSLSVFEANASSLPVDNERLLNLTHLPLSEKLEQLTSLTEDVLNGNQDVQQAQSMMTLLEGDSTASYTQWAVPMQGTSTGNSRAAVRYSWEKESHQEGWMSVSKGGGYCRWMGLNRYRVEWGTSGERLRKYPGHALRNVDVIHQTALVFSDTGTQGLNVRLRRDQQVFIASGPGIRLTAGDPLSHLAYLNSRLASAVLREINPKLTIAAGYIKKLPFASQLANHQDNAALALICVRSKENILSRKLTNDECDLDLLELKNITTFSDYFSRQITLDVQNELKKLDAESAIENHILDVLTHSPAHKQALEKRLGLFGFESDAPLTAATLENELGKLLGRNCDLKPRALRRGMGGADGIVEAVAKSTQHTPQAVAASLLSLHPQLSSVQNIYFDDLMHKLVLSILGFHSNLHWHPATLSIQSVQHQVEQYLPEAAQWRTLPTPTASFHEWVVRVLPALHDQVFLACPLLFVTQEKICLDAQATR